MRLSKMAFQCYPSQTHGTVIGFLNQTNQEIRQCFYENQISNETAGDRARSGVRIDIGLLGAGSRHLLLVLFLSTLATQQFAVP
jgi:hypothetical protein